MATFNEIEQYIIDQLTEFSKGIPNLENGLYNAILLDLAKLDVTKAGDLKRTGANLKKVIAIQRSLNDAVTDTKYINDLRNLFKSTSVITDMINEYYRDTFKTGRPGTLANAVRDASKNVIVESMTRGLTSSLTDALRPILNDAVISGQSYASLADQIKDTVRGVDGPGIVSRYATQIATDTLNGYSRQYNWAMQSGLGFQWYQYTGTNIVTTRDFCIAAKRKKYIHVSEFTDVVLGNFKEFKDIDGKIYERYGLPQGMRLGTNKDNFPLYCGGYNCGHTLRPVYVYQVPKAVQEALYKTDTYKKWKQDNPGKYV